MYRTRLLLVLLLPLLGLYGAGQSTTRGAAEIEQLQVKREGADVTIEVILTGAVTPAVETAINPDRLVLTLPGTLSDAKQKHFPLDANGVHGVRVGLNSAKPLVTRLVVDMDSAHPYTVTTEGTHIILRVQSNENATAERRNGAVPAASAPIIGAFRRKPPAPPTDNSNATAQVPIPVPPTLPPINFPGDQSTSAQPATATAATTAPITTPSATHPKLGSLQEGTVFPGMGTPGTGTVPQTQSQAANTAPANSNASSAPLSVTVTQGGSGSSATPGAPTATAAQNAIPGTAIAPAAGSATASVPSPDSTAKSSLAAATTIPVSKPVVQANSGTTTAAAAPSAATTASVAPAVGTTGSTASAAGAPSVTAKVLSATATPPTPATTAVPAVSVASTPATPTSQAPAPASSVAVPSGGTTVATGQGGVLTSSPTPTSTTPTPAASGAEAADTTTIAKATEPEIPVGLALRATHPDFRTTFRIKYVAEGVAYLDGGRSAGLTEGMKLVVRETPTGSVVAAAEGNDDNIVAELEVMSVAEASAVVDIHTPKRDVKPGELAYLSSQDEQALVQQSTLSATRKYPTVISFTEQDTLDEEARAEIPRPPMPSVNRARGRIGFDYMGTSFHGATGGISSDVGLVARLDMSRIGGTYWNLSGYWRGNLTANSYAGSATIQDLINRTYHISMIYDSPTSPWVAGFGRMYLPWATSIDTIDGGYFGRRIGHGATMGIFAGSTPDPTSYSYNPNQRIGGGFVNFEGGSYDGLRYTSTVGAGVNTVDWQITRPFIFYEGGVFYKRYVSIYDSLQADNPVGNQATLSPGPGIGRNFTTIRFQPQERIEFDANYNYFRDLPTFDPTLIGTGLLDKYLFQGFSVGARLEVLKQIWLYTTLGKSNRSGDTSSSLNELYGITFGRLPFKVRADAHYSKFNSSFGSGYYESVSVSRNLSDNLRLELLGGQQNFSSAYSANSNSKFVTGNLEMNMGLHYFIQGGFTASRGVVQNYDQWLLTFGYRFDSKQRVGQ